MEPNGGHTDTEAPIPQPQSQQPAPAASGSPEFKRVFSTTIKVILSLLLISVGIGLLWLIIVAMDSSGRPDLTNFNNAYVNNRDYYNQNADEKPTKMPASQWKRVVAEDIRGHCVHEGMTPAEVVKAVGKPTSEKTVQYSGPSDTGVVWEYIKKVGETPCTKYAGEKCVEGGEPEMKKATLYFSPAGHLTYPYLYGPLKEDSNDDGFCY